MASGISLVEFDEKKAAQGFIPKLYENLVKTMGEERMDKIQKIRDDPEEIIK